MKRTESNKGNSIKEKDIAFSLSLVVSDSVFLLCVFFFITYKTAPTITMTFECINYCTFSSHAKVEHFSKSKMMHFRELCGITHSVIHVYQVN